MVSSTLTYDEVQQFLTLVDARSVRADLAVFYRAGYLESMVHSMSQEVPGVAEYVRQRMVVLAQKDESS